MGSGTSRGKKVAPARASEAAVTAPASRVASSKRDGPLKPLDIQAILRNARNRAQKADRRSEGRDSDSSGDDEEAEAHAVVAEAETRERTPPPPKRMKSRTYGLCHFSREDADDDCGSAPRLRASGTAEEPRGSRAGARDVNRSNDAFTHAPARSSLNNDSQRSAPEAGATSHKQTCCGSSLTTPVTLYDGSDEELMDTIEREFS